MDTKHITKGSFYGYIKNQRKAFALEVSKYSVEHNLKLRTESDSLLIAYDQMRDRIKELENALDEIKHDYLEQNEHKSDMIDRLQNIAKTALNNKQK